MEEHQEEHLRIAESLGRIEQNQKNMIGHVDRLDKRVNGAFHRIDKHISEGERPGGYRDKLIRLETLVTTATKEKLNSVKSSQYRVSIITGVTCSLPGAIWVILKIIKHFNS